MYIGVPSSWPHLVAAVSAVSWRSIALAMPKSMILGTGPLSLRGDQHIRRLDVAMDDSFLMRVLDGIANDAEQLQPLWNRQFVLISVLGDGHALDQLHHEVGTGGGEEAGA